MANQLVSPGLAPLTSARTVHLDAATGSDTTGDGSSAHPWQTLAKAWADRLTYGELRAVYTIQLHGVGPYTMPAFGASLCGDSGFFMIKGDPLVDVSIVTGTFTGDLNTTSYAVGTSPGLALGLSGSAASITTFVSSTLTLTGLTGMTASLIGSRITLSGAASAGNNGSFAIASVISASSITVTNVSGVASDANSGAIVWSVTDTLKTYFLEITSGNCTGVRTNIVINTDTSISIPDRSWQTSLGAIANGNTFRVFAPGTVIDCPVPAVGSLLTGPRNWVGGTLFESTTEQSRLVRHLFYNVTISLTGRLAIVESEVAFVGVRTTGTSAILVSRSNVGLGAALDASYLVGGSPALNSKLTSYGLSISSTPLLLIGGQTVVQGSYYIGGATIVGTTSVADNWISWGGRHDGGLTLNGARFEVFNGSTQYIHSTKTKTVTQRAALYIAVGSGGKWVEAVTSGNCFTVQKDSFLGYGSYSVSGISGGTSDPAGYAVQLDLAGGTVVIHGGAPVLTGGIVGNDFKTRNFIRPNAFFAAAGDVLSDLGGAEIVVRI